MITTTDESIAYYKTIEDPFDHDDWEAYFKFQADIGDSAQIVEDYLLVRDPKRVQKAIDVKACNALLLSDQSVRKQDRGQQGHDHY